jgi:outer membrane murein-binding lipoprotein Lpp
MPRVGAFFTTRNLADGPLICALVLTVLVSVALLWANTATHAAIDERVVAAATRQNELTALVANLTTDVDAVVEELMTLAGSNSATASRSDARPSR